MHRRGAPVFGTWSARRRSDLGLRYSDARMTMSKRAKISTHYGADEFDCHDGTAWPPAARAALEWWAAVWGEPLRQAFGPVRVASGFRTPSYNIRVGGAKSSFHIYTLRYGPRAVGSAGVGVAVDCIPSRGHVGDWQRWASGRQSTLTYSRSAVDGVVPFGRLAAVGYPSEGFIHLDTGPRRSWVG